MRYLGYFDMFNTCISDLSPRTFNIFCNTLLLTDVCYCTALSEKAVIYCLTMSTPIQSPTLSTWHSPPLAINAFKPAKERTCVSAVKVSSNVTKGFTDLDFTGV